MANFCGVTRTNYFRVKDRAAFEAMAKKAGLEVITDDENRVGLLPDSSDDGSFPSFIYPENPDEPEEEFDAVSEIAAHLVPGEVCVIVTAGYEKMRYVVGQACAFDARGIRVTIDIDNIYELAKTQFPGASVTRAEY